jgi:proteasome activator subunit 4
MIESLCLDSDKFKQRAGVEFLLGYTRGAKHWPSQFNKSLWDWVMARLPKFFASIKPDTRHLWDSYFCVRTAYGYKKPIDLLSASAD